MAFIYNPLVEMWTLYVVGSIIIFLRVATRWRMVGFQGFKPDDYIIWFSWVCRPVPTVRHHFANLSLCDRSYTP